MLMTGSTYCSIDYSIYGDGLKLDAAQRRWFSTLARYRQRCRDGSFVGIGAPWRRTRYERSDLARLLGIFQLDRPLESL